MAMKIGLTEARIQVRKEKKHLYHIESSTNNFKLISQSFWFLSDIANAECNIMYKV